MEDTIPPHRPFLGLAVLAAVLTVACTIPSPEAPAATAPPPMAPRAHGLALPTSAITSAQPQAITFPERDLAATELTDPTSWSLRVPKDLEDELILVRFRERDAQVQAAEARSNTQLDTPEGSPGRTIAYLLVSGADLNRGGILVNPLVDYISRRMEDYKDSLPQERIALFQDRLAQAFIQTDLDGDQLVTFADALVFDPANPQHLERLSFDYREATTAPLHSGLSLADTYAKNPDALEEALVEAFEDEESVRLPEAAERGVAIIQVDVDHGGSLTIDELPRVELDADNPRYIHKAERKLDAPSRLHLRAVAEEGFRFARWVGCERVAADSSCEVTVDQDREIGAQFLLARTELVEGITGVVKLGLFDDDSYRLHFPSDDEIVISDVSDASLAAELSSANVATVLATMRWQAPLLQITETVPPSTTEKGTFRFKVAKVSPPQVYRSISVLEPARPPTLDDVVHMEITGVEPPATPVVRGAKRKDPSAGVEDVPGEIWIAGHGRALPAGLGLYLTEDRAGGFSIVRPTERMVIARGEDAIVAMQQACERDPGAPDCKELRTPMLRSQTNPCSAVGVKCSKLASKTLKIKGVNVGNVSVFGHINLSPIGSGGYRYSIAPFAGIDAWANGRGTLEVTLAASLFLGFQGQGDAIQGLRGRGQHFPVGRPRASGGPDALMNLVKDEVLGEEIDGMGAAGEALGQAAGEIEIEDDPRGESESESLFELSLQLNRTTPDGLLFPLKLKLKPVIGIKGKLGLQATDIVQLSAVYDLDADLGWPCGGWVTTCSPIPKLPQKAEGHVKIKVYNRLETGAVANVELKPGFELSLTYGPNTVSEELFQIGARVSTPLKLVGSVSGYILSNFPNDEAEDLSPTCKELRWSLALSLDKQFEVFAKINPTIKISSFGGKFKPLGLPEITIAEWKIGSPILNPRVYGGSPLAADPEACLPLEERPARLFADAKTFAPGELRWDEPAMVMTKNRKLVLQQDGNLVLYALTRTGDDHSGRVKETRAVWSSKTSGYPGTRVSFQPDGNLVVYDLRETARYGTSTHDKGAKTLELTKEGDLVIRGPNDAVLWSSASEK